MKVKRSRSLLAPFQTNGGCRRRCLGLKCCGSVTKIAVVIKPPRFLELNVLAVAIETVFASRSLERKT